MRLRSLTWEASGARFAGGAITAVVGELWLQGLELWWGDRSVPWRRNLDESPLALWELGRWSIDGVIGKVVGDENLARLLVSEWDSLAPELATVRGFCWWAGLGSQGVCLGHNFDLYFRRSGARLPNSEF